MGRLVKTIKSKDYRSEIHEYTTQDKSVVYGANHYWKSVFFKITPSTNSSLDDFEKYVRKRMKRFDCTMVDENRFSCEGHFYSIPQKKSE